MNHSGPGAPKICASSDSNCKQLAESKTAELHHVSYLIRGQTHAGSALLTLTLPHLAFHPAKTYAIVHPFGRRDAFLPSRGSAAKSHPQSTSGGWA